MAAARKSASCSSFALHACRRLLALNPNNYKYHDGLRAALQLQPDAQGRWTAQQRRSLTSLYDALAKEHPSSSAVKRIPLDFKVSPCC
jgi:peptide alpha-N-acetyltransferase